MATKKRKQKHVEETNMKLDVAEQQERADGEQGSGPAAAAAEQQPTRAARGKGKPRERKPKVSRRVEAKEPRAQRDAVLDLSPADDIKPLRAGTHLAHVVELTARPEGATAVELDKAIVTTAKSVKHYGIWALRYPLHKQKGFGFRTVLTDGEPARYHLVLPKGQKLESYVTAPATERKKAARKVAPEPVARRIKKAIKGHGKKAVAHA